MKRFLAIRVERPHRGYASLVRLHRRGEDRRDFTPIERGQTDADVTFYQVDRRGRRQRVRQIRSIRVAGLDNHGGTPDTISFTARFDGRSEVQVEIRERGRLRERLELSVDREPRNAWWLVALIPPILIGALLLVRSGPWSDRSDIAADVPTPAVEPLSASTDTAPIGGSTPDASPSAPPTENGAPEAARTTVNPETGDLTGSPIPPAEDAPVDNPVDAVGTVVRIYFEPDETVLTATAQRQLETAISEIDSGGVQSVRIVGHAAPYGNELGRSGISRGRALAVRDALLSIGWDLSEGATVEWRGASEPVTVVPEDQYLNRRVELRVTVGE